MAVCHLNSRAATWYIRMEATGDSPQNVQELRKLMFKKFVPSIQKSQAKMSLLALRMNSKNDVGKHIKYLKS